jgi:hypothetical protein
VVILNDVPRLPRDAVDRLAEHAQRGNGVWIILGPRTDESFLTAVLTKTPLAPVTARPPLHVPVAVPSNDPAGPPPAPITIDIREPGNPSVALLTSAQRNALVGVTLRGWWPVTPTDPQMHTVLATTGTTGAQDGGIGGGDPIALDLDVGKAGGRVILWTTPVGNIDWNNFPWVPNFTPLVNETLFHLASGQDAGQPRQLEAGAPLLWTGPATAPIDAATLITPSGIQRTLQPQLRGNNYLVGDTDTHEPGLYQLQFTAPPTRGAAPPPAAYFSVNFDPAELDPATLSAADLDWFKRQGYLANFLTAETLPQALDARQGGVEVWWLLGVLLLGLLVVEVAMTRNLARQQGATLKDASLAAAAPATAAAGGAR